MYWQESCRLRRLGWRFPRLRCVAAPAGLLVAESRPAVLLLPVRYLCPRELHRGALACSYECQVSLASSEGRRRYPASGLRRADESEVQVGCSRLSQRRDRLYRYQLQGAQRETPGLTGDSAPNRWDLHRQRNLWRT